MIIGAGQWQVPLIRKAVSLGLYVITVDYLPENIGHTYSHRYLNISTVNNAEIYEAARTMGIDGIATMASDIATSTVGFVAEKLGLPGGPFSAAHLMSHKARFREFQSEKGLMHPSFISGYQWGDIEERISMLSLPLVFKPADSSGSRGISLVDHPGRESLQRAFEYAVRYSRSGSVCVEELVEGEDISGDGFMTRGRFSGLVTHKYKQGFVPTGHCLPATLSPENQAAVLSAVEAHCLAAGYPDGPLDFDAIVNADGVTILEMSPRLGGNCIPAIVTRATGADMMALSLMFSLGETADIPDAFTVTRACGAYIFGSAKKGRLSGIASREELTRAVPEVYEYRIFYAAGDSVPAFEHSGNSMGYALFDIGPEAGYDDMVGTIDHSLHIETIE